MFDNQFKKFLVFSLTFTGVMVLATLRVVFENDILLEGGVKSH